MRPSTPVLAFLVAAVFLVVWPLTVQKPGLPYALKADEPAYYLAARSLWHDHDLDCDRGDLVRSYDDFFYPVENLILASRDGWRTAFYAKPYLGSLLAAPLVAAFGANGFVALNMLYLLACVALGWAFLARRNPSGLSLIAAGGYFFLSTAFAYVFWLQPEVLSLLSLTATLYFAFAAGGDGANDARPPGRLARLVDRHQLLLAGLSIGPAVNAKPPYLLFVLPALYSAWRRRRLAGVLALGLGTLLSVGGIAAGQKALTGAWSPYLGSLRRGFNVPNPLELPWAPLRAAVEAAERRGTLGREIVPADGQKAWDDRARTGTDWSWIVSLPQTTGERLPFDLVTFLVGRHTGAFTFYPMLLVALGWFLAGGGARDPCRWLVLLAWLGTGLFFVLWHFDNYHGGAGFVGNRYLVPIYGAGLFLVDRLRPRLLLVAGAALSGLFLGQVVFAPLGPPVDEPTLQAYARPRPFDLLPREVNLPDKVPGYRGVEQAGAWLSGRKDRLRDDGGWLTVLGRGPTEIALQAPPDRRSFAFLLRSYAPGNEVRLGLGNDRARVRFPDAAPPPEGASALAVLRPGRPERELRRYTFSERESWWFLRVDPGAAASPAWWGFPDRQLVGVRLLHLGPEDRLEHDVYGIDWLSVEAPASVAARSRFPVAVVLGNRSPSTWTQDSPVQVSIGYRWRDRDGRELAAESVRTNLPRPLRPGEAIDLQVEVAAPAEPGEHELVLEPVYEYVRWFGDVQPEARYPLALCVDPAPAPHRPAGG